MDASLQSYSNDIESILCKIDKEYNCELKDQVALDIYKLLMDKYYFNDKEFVFKSDIAKDGFELINEIIMYNGIDKETLIKIVGVLYFISNRRTKGGREYFNVIQYYVGGGNGVQILSTATEMDILTK